MRRMMFILIFVAANASQGLAQQPTSVGTVVTFVRTGWNSDSFAIGTREPIANPAHCGTADGYISEIADPGYRTFYAAALTAYVTKNNVVVVVDPTKCISGRPRLVGIDLH